MKTLKPDWCIIT